MRLAIFDPLADFLYPTLEIVSVSTVAIIMLMISLRVMERFMPFNVRKELEEDHNVAAAIVMGAVIFGVALVISSVAKE